ncbi:MAG: peptidyl-prolyl cis-trans isomerase [Phycisphaerae bacterium]|nr:peptidyl-prolyl cis-trans isomerase [Phycisphaerae bacterium]
MESKPKLELPQRAVSRQPIFTRRTTFFAVWTLVLFGVVVALLARNASKPEVQARTSGGWPADQQKALAMRLEDRNLHEAAAEAWSRYVEIADLAASDQAAIHYRIGKLRQSAERFEQAIADLYQAEALLGEARGDLQHEINVRVRDCFTRLGQYGDLERDLVERTAVSDEKPGRLAGQQVVAEIGPEKITAADFDRMIQQEVDLALKAMPGLPDEQKDAYRQEIMKQFASQQAKTQKLQELVSVKVLAREARGQGLDKAPAFRKRLVEMSDMLLANKLLSDEIGRRATVTIDDCKRFYEANKARYVEPGRAQLAHIACKTEAEAAEVIKKLKAGAKFEDLAKTLSVDAASKDKGGVIDQPASEPTARVPGIGEDKALHEAIFKARPDTVLDKPYKGAGGFHVVKVLTRTETRQLTLDEAADRVRADTQRSRTREITEQYIKGLFDEAKVKFYPEALAPGAARPATSQPGPVSASGEKDGK